MVLRALSSALLLLALAAPACSGRDPLGDKEPPPRQTIPLGDAAVDHLVPDDLPLFDADAGDLPDLPDLLPPDLIDDLLPDLPPTPCESDDDCPPTGAEPCFVPRCLLDETGQGLCQAEPGLVCETDNPCAEAVCAKDEGCVEIAGPDDLPCDDANACSDEDRCLNGLCKGVPRACGDDNPCTADLCNPETGECYHLDVPGDCDDLDACTAPDQCLGGSCQPGPPVDCNDLDDCTEDACIPAAGCQHKPIPGCCVYDLQCTDGNACTNDWCDALQCHHLPLVCDDKHPCTVDGCDPETGCTHAKIPGCCVDDLDCQDDDICTVKWCADGQCQATPYTGCKDGNPCTKDGCDPAVGCVFLPIPGCCLTDGDCDDGDACTWQWCNGNQCVAEPIPCTDGNPCTEDTCDPVAGCLFPPIPGCCLADSECNDQNQCTTDWCSNKSCFHKPITCLDNNPCTENLCEPAKGCVFPLIPGCCQADSDCADTDPCTLTACVNKKCLSDLLDCDDGNVCTTDACVPMVGCSHALLPGCCLDADGCDDGDVCTLDKCVGNQCVYEPLVTPECCTPDCAGKECGPDGCGGSCGACVDPFFCNDNGLCVDICVPDCKGKECGPDGCGTYCGICPDDFTCSEGGQCIPCFPQCAGKECGPDGCGGSCGLCPLGDACDSESGQCVPPCGTCSGPTCYQDGFESGELDGWSFEGDAEVIHNMGATEAPQGWYMAFVGTGLSELELGKLQKTFCPPKSHKFFGFKWKHYSAEFTEWCGSIYQDHFIVTIDNGSKKMTLLDLSIDQLCPETACNGCGSKYIGLEPADVEFDSPDVWMTPWSTAFFELPDGFTDTPITVTFEVSDVGDMVYVTAILIDAIQFL
jgi:hypothetical protein